MKLLFKSFLAGFVLGAFLLVALAASLLLSGCGAPSPETQLIGKWQKPGTTESIQFFPTGDAHFVKGRDEFTTTYRWVDDTHVRTGATVIEIKVDGDALTTQSIDGTENWRRVN